MGMRKNNSSFMSSRPSAKKKSVIGKPEWSIVFCGSILPAILYEYSAFIGLEITPIFILLVVSNLFIWSIPSFVTSEFGKKQMTNTWFQNHLATDWLFFCVISLAGNGIIVIKEAFSFLALARQVGILAPMLCLIISITALASTIVLIKKYLTFFSDMTSRRLYFAEAYYADYIASSWLFGNSLRMIFWFVGIIIAGLMIVAQLALSPDLKSSSSKNNTLISYPGYSVQQKIDSQTQTQPQTQVNSATSPK